MVPSEGFFDVHAHFLPLGAPPESILGYFPDAPHVLSINRRDGIIVKGGEVFRKVTSSLWDIETRLSELDRNNISNQLISPVPVALRYDAPVKHFARYCRWINDSVAKHVNDSRGRIFGLGTLPLLDSDGALKEIEHLRNLGLVGIEIGTRVGDVELDDPRLSAVFDALDHFSMAVLVHPVEEGRGVIRRTGFAYDFGIGMLTDTAMAATALALGGVLDKYSNIRFAMVHGCGSFPWTYPRIRLGAEISGSHIPADLDDSVRRMYIDSLVFGADHFKLIENRFGRDKILLGTDYPFIPHQPQESLELLTASGVINLDAIQETLNLNAQNYIGIL